MCHVILFLASVHLVRLRQSMFGVRVNVEKIIDMAQYKISVIGAGIGGLVLGRALLSRGITATIYEKAQLTTLRHNYAITLQSSSYRHLLQIINIDEQDLRSRIAVDARIGGKGYTSQTSDQENTPIRVNRATLENLLREGLDIRWDSNIKTVFSGLFSSPSLCLDSGQKKRSDIVIGADGVHSLIRNESLPNERLEVLPFVVFNGKKRVDRQSYDDKYSSYLRDVNTATTKQGDTLLSIGLDDIDEGSASLSWTYSRPARSKSDPLHKPDRSNSKAKDTPEELYQEIRTVQRLPEPFASMFNVESMKQDRTLHWLMRKTLIPLDKLQELGKEGLWLLGDSVHAEQILGGNGANTAIEDAIHLAEHIAQHECKHVDQWYAKRYPAWEEAQRDSLSRIYDMHGLSLPKI